MENISSIKQGMSYRAKLLTSFSVYFCTFSLGLSAYFLSSSLLELSNKFNTDISTISKVFSVITISFLAGAILSGPMFNYFNRQVSAAVLQTLLGFCVMLLPQAPSLVTLFIIAGVLGIAAGGYDIAQIVWIIEMWENPRVYIQIQHFAFALGTLMSPLLVKPFLSIDPLLNPDLKNVTNESYVIRSIYNITDSNVSYNIIESKDDPVEPSRLFIPFTIGGCLSILGGLFIVILFYFNKYEAANKSHTEESGAEIEPDKKAEESLMVTKVLSNRTLLVTLSAIFLGAYQGMEMCSMQFLPSFTHYIDLKLTKQDGALVLSSLAASFTLGRAIGILIVFRVVPEVLLLGNVILIIFGNGILLLFANSSEPFLWVGSVLLGIGFSTVFPSFYGYIEKHLKISNVVGAIMIVAGGIVSALYPIVIGSTIEENPFVLMYTNFFSILACTVSFVIIFVVTRSKSSDCLDVERVHSKAVDDKGKHESIQPSSGSIVS